MNLNDIVIVIGMPRAGTTWLYENLKNHPAIGVSDYKEINRYLLNISDQEYLGYFKNCSQKIKIDISPLYFFNKNALVDISKQHDKVILVVREASTWVDSLNAQIKKYKGNADLMSETKKYSFPLSNGDSVHFDFGEYRQTDYINEIKNIFNKNLLLLDFNMLQSDPAKLMAEIENFIGVNHYFTKENLNLNKINSSDQKISPIYSYLIENKYFHKILPYILIITPRKITHMLRKYFIYGE